MRIGYLKVNQSNPAVKLARLCYHVNVTQTMFLFGVSVKQQPSKHQHHQKSASEKPRPHVDGIGYLSVTVGNGGFRPCFWDCVWFCNGVD